MIFHLNNSITLFVQNPINNQNQIIKIFCQQLYCQRDASWIRCDMDVASTMHNAVVAMAVNPNIDMTTMTIVN